MEKEESPKPSKKPRNKNILVISTIGLILSILGIMDGTYLTITHYTTKIVLACPNTGFIDCAKVTSSSYSEIHGIPAAVLGLAFFLGMFILQLPMLWRSKNSLIKNGRLAYSIAGLISIFWFVYVEFHKLHAICLYCTGVHILTFLLFVTTLIGSSIVYSNTSEKVS
jgi:uncharacterized membrane protein